MNNIVVIEGELGLVSRILGDMELEDRIDGELEKVLFVDSRTEYPGPYEVTPTQQTQTLPTTGFIMGHDVVVNPIPQNYGLITWNGSVLTVS